MHRSKNHLNYKKSLWRCLRCNVIKALTYAISDDSLSRVILKDKDKSLIKPGNDYSLETLKIERDRIDALLKDKGYFYFSPDYLLFKADTSDKDHTVAFRLTLKDSIPSNALTVYRINKVYIDQNYSIRRSNPDSVKATIVFQNYTFYGRDTNMNIKPAVIIRSVYLKKNDIYSRQNHNITLNRLMSMGNFKFVQIKFSDSDTTAPRLSGCEHTDDHHAQSHLQDRAGYGLKIK